MRWDDFRRSDNVEDSRDGGGGFGMPGGGGFSVGGGGLGIGTIVVLGLIGWALGIDPSILIGGAEILGGGGGQPQVQQVDRPRPSRNAPPADQMGQFVSAVLGDTEDTWTEIFSQSGETYRKPRLVLYAGSLPTPCAYAQSAMGPFYCPRDQRVYLDTSFFRDMQTKFRACSSQKACEFAEAYVIAHEVGHHVQNLLGILPKVQQAQQNARSKAEANQMQVRVELQADCFGGVWANRSNKRRNFIDPGDVDEALQTATAIGDDRLQKQTQGYVVPDSFTHGSSEQRKRWFLTGFEKGTVSACNTFNTAQL
ncbi:MAG: KPN_02809 family neutral zinc metallopeptidase [Vulcanimicrobiaceae bacterium]